MPRTSRSTRRSPRRIAASLVVVALLASACNGDDATDDPSGDENSEGATPSPTETGDPPAAAPGWAQDPEEVRSLKDARFVSEVGDVGWEPDQSAPCAFRPDRFAVYLGEDAASPPDQIEGFELFEGDDTLAAIGVALYAVSEEESPIDAAQEVLSEEGLLASPVHLVFPAPGRMFFPGTMPVPDESSLDEVDAVGGVRVAVVDTGGNPTEAAGQVVATGDEELFRDANTPRPVEVDPMTYPWTFGHGSFVADIVHRESELAPTVFRVRESDGYFDEELVADQLARAEGFDVVNVSLGTFPCYVAEGPIVPVITLAAAAHGLGADAVLVAAAGNSGDQRLTMPAALAAPVGDWDVGWEVTAEDLDAAVAADCPADGEWLVTVECLRATGPTVVAVGAAVEDGVADYSTTGPWVTTERPGCRIANHPGGWIEYPAHAGEDEVKLDLGTVVRWCGTSFATPVVTAEIATALLGDPQLDVEQLVDGFAPPSPRSQPTPSPEPTP